MRPGVSVGGNCTVMPVSSPDSMVAGMPSKVTDTLAPFKCEPLTIAKDPGDTAVETGRAAVPTLCSTMVEGRGTGGAGGGGGDGPRGGKGLPVKGRGGGWMASQWRP